MSSVEGTAGAGPSVVSPGTAAKGDAASALVALRAAAPQKGGEGGKKKKRSRDD